MLIVRGYCFECSVGVLLGACVFGCDFTDLVIFGCWFVMGLLSGDFWLFVI